ncbi:NADP-dependent oxidoreductase [Nocardioides nitrophenolicus]|uniref:NADP-dependent oxidoreductase n=1 Tax=Nocardioides nitrophenolicus TaxID=60489 RepID=UPI001EF887A6|nr:NADP-dependent oxidoreductase [Nocardioides nitrophenolicus]MBM7518506.1 NADPH-dependent curcumin reductase CurA [Nocardioides nitrophenolicus]
MKSAQLHVTTYPTGPVGPEQFVVAQVDLPGPDELAVGEVLVRNTWTSVDPGLRLRLRAAAPDGYFAAFPLGEAMDGILTVGEVVASRADGFAPGDTVSHSLGWREHAVVRAGEEAMNGIGTLRRLDVTSTQPQWYLGPLGPMGLTAYSGLAVVDALDGGGVLWVSAGAGAVGSLVAQFARELGHRVIATAGSPDKVAWLRDQAGVEAFSYRDEPLRAGLARLAPDGIDVYFDNVGGDHLEAALDALRPHGRIAMCGTVSDYESEPTGPRNIFLATAKHLTIQGFRGSLHLDLLPELEQRVGQWLRDGSVVYRESVYDGLASAPEAMADMLAGRTVGKTLVRL